MLLLRQYRNDIIDGAVELIRGQGDDAFQNSENGYVYVFKQSEINDEEAPRTGIVIEEDETGTEHENNVNCIIYLNDCSFS